MPNFHSRLGESQIGEAELEGLVAKYALKFAWFLQKGYTPHFWQTLFHCMTNPDTNVLCRYRHLVAGRRGGKTLSAAWEVLYYILHPEEFHFDVHGVEDDRPLYVWVVAKDHPTGKAALDAFRQVLKEAGLEHGREYKENRGNRWFEFENGAFVHFRSAEDPQSLRGAGLDIMWIDEAAFIPNADAWNVSRPALSDHRGLLLTTTTPDGKNWLYQTFWSGKAELDPRHGRVEYRSIDNPYFPQEEWEELLETYHPLLFKQEFMASFDSMAGKELAGDWLHYYEASDLPKDLVYSIGVDPAISLAEEADRFVITLVGITTDKTQAYLVEQWAGRIPFAEQVQLIQEWYLKWRPPYIGVESNAYQAALAQQVMRIPGLIPIVPMLAKGKKFERILAMAPLFRASRIKIRRDHADFITEWIDYDSTKKNPSDDCLDSCEIALRAAGALLPLGPGAIQYGLDKPATDMNELALRQRPKPSSGKDEDFGLFDEYLGADW